MKQPRLRFPLLIACALANMGALHITHAQSIESILDFQDLPDLPVSIAGEAIGTVENSILLVAGSIDTEATKTVYQFQDATNSWSSIGEWQSPVTGAGFSSDGSQLILAGGRTAAAASDLVTRFTLQAGQVQISELPPLPQPMHGPATLIEKGFLYVAGSGESGNLFARLSLTATNASWETLPAFPGSPREGAVLLRSFNNQIYLVGGYHEGAPVLQTLEYSLKFGWLEKKPIPSWIASPSAIAFGESHLLVFGATDHHAILAYHTITDTWVEMGIWENAPGNELVVTLKGPEIYIVGAADARKIKVYPLKTKYGWVDHGVVLLYLLGMVGVGIYFTNKGKDTKDYFQGGKKIPWWATGMSLFATMASAISLMTMPGKSFSGNWEWYTISIFSAITLPISLFVLAPIIRKLNIRTSNEYLDRRFGTIARMMGSTIFVLFQLLGRMAPIMLLPAIALNAITGISVEVCILIMAAVSISYTFMGGLSAVIWTDTIQGFIMFGTIAACLVMALFMVGMNPIDLATSAWNQDKLLMWDWTFDVSYPVAWLFFINILFVTLNNMGDQNFVQRVQSTSSLRETQKAIGLQMSVAVTVNALLFAVGTVLYFYYQQHPTQLNPSMRADGIYPFFSAQHLPVGASGLVVAALLAATLSTVSGSICSVANLGVDDFYRRFWKNATETSALNVGRVLTLVVGLIGTSAALFLANADMPSIWDLALLIVGLVTNGLVGMFALGLITKRAHQTGMIIGVITGMTTVFLLRQNTPINFLLYMPIGSTITFMVGYLTSILIPAPKRDIHGLTLYTIRKGSDC
jgi:solute:Na+ symporter, SSS family